MGKTKRYILTGLMTALVFVLTFIIKIPIPFTPGYIHLGDSMIYISVMILGPFFGAFAAGLGSMFADILGGYAQYALPTLIIKSLMALVMGLILSVRTRKSSIASVITIVSIWTVFSAGTFLYLRSQINRIGLDNIVTSIAGSSADSTARKQTADTINNLPVYLTVGIIVIIAILAAAVYFFSRRGDYRIFTVKAVIGMTAAGMCMVMGYFLTDSLMYSPIAAILSIPMNIIQFFGGIIAAGFFAPAIKKAQLAIGK